MSLNTWFSLAAGVPSHVTPWTLTTNCRLYLVNYCLLYLGPKGQTRLAVDRYKGQQLYCTNSNSLFDLLGTGLFYLSQYDLPTIQSWGILLETRCPHNIKSLHLNFFLQ